MVVRNDRSWLVEIDFDLLGVLVLVLLKKGSSTDGCIACPLVLLAASPHGGINRSRCYVCVYACALSKNMASGKM